MKAPELPAAFPAAKALNHLPAARMEGDKVAAVVDDVVNDYLQLIALFGGCIDM